MFFGQEFFFKGYLDDLPIINVYKDQDESVKIEIFMDTTRWPMLFESKEKIPMETPFLLDQDNLVKIAVFMKRRKYNILFSLLSIIFFRNT